VTEVEIFRNDTNRSKLPSRRNKEQTKLGECLLPFSSEVMSHHLTKHLKIKVYRAIKLPVVLYGCET